ncbi:MAG: hypothetical protein AMJ53_09090 [Gammaproteobacteria bacterium SG8_11]|nr:MAG: hypothetical protein AMJ53_09090 [Gammaproteobacteria bacterium SG8_11]
MARTRRRSASNPIVEFFSKDPFGVTWFTLLFIAVLIAKWWYIDPPAISAQSCLACVTALMVVFAIVVTLLISVFWILWIAKRQKKNLLFLFLITVLILACTALFDFVSQEAFSQLYYRGFLPWHEMDVTYLLDDFLRHSAGLYLGVLVIYAMLRIAFDPGFAPRKYVIPINLAFIAVAAFLLLMGIMLY